MSRDDWALHKTWSLQGSITNLPWSFSIRVAFASSTIRKTKMGDRTTTNRWVQVCKSGYFSYLSCKTLNLWPLPLYNLSFLHSRKSLFEPRDCMLQAMDLLKDETFEQLPEGQLRLQVKDTLAQLEQFMKTLGCEMWNWMLLWMIWLCQKLCMKMLCCFWRNHVL